MNNTMPFPPQILSMRERAAHLYNLLGHRLNNLLPRLMREAGLDMWLIICQEDNLDPIFQLLIPMDTWCPILQILVFYDRGDALGVERLNLSMTNTQGLYERPWTGRHHEEQWELLRQTIEARDPQRIGVNVGAIQWAAGGLTKQLFDRLAATLPEPYLSRLVSAEPLIARFASILTDDELTTFHHVVHVAHHLLARCYSSETIVPGVTTTRDLEWAYWQMAADLGLDLAFKPFFNLVRSNDMRARYGDDDQTIRPGDMIHSDVGIKYLRLNSDHQEWAYVLRPGEHAVPAGLQRLMTEGNRLQNVFMATFAQGLTGNQLLEAILAQAHRAGISKPKVYSHSLGFFLHEPGPLIGLPWEQERCPGRGDVALEFNQTFTMELSITAAVPEWGDQEVTFSMEQDVAFTRDGCYAIDGRQTAFILIS
jgi:Xaa-Pro aminopeptidase